MHETVAPHVIALVETLRRFLCAGEFIARHRVRPADFTRQRQLTFPVIMLFTLQKTVKSLQRHLHEFLDELAGGGLFEPVTAGAWTHARAKLKHTAFIELNRECVLPALYGQAPPASLRRWRGHRLLGVDSSVVRLPEHPEMFVQFRTVAVSNQSGPTGTSYPEGRVSVLYDLLNRVGLDGRLEPSGTGEVALAIEQLAHAAPGDVTLSDRGFAGFPYLAWHHRLGLHFVARCSRSSFGTAQELFRKNRAGHSLVVKLCAPPHERVELRRLGLPLELAVRFVSVRLPTGELEVLATSLREEEKYPTADFLALYHCRWHHETFYGLLKGRLELENFSGQTPEAVRQDFHATVLLCNLESVLTAGTAAALQEQSRNHEQPAQVNRAVSFHALKHELLPLLYGDLPVGQVIAKLQAWFAGAPVSVRPGRKVPRRTPALARSYHFQRRVKKAVF
jgi:hypothetical protein